MFPRICSVCGKTFYAEGSRRPKYCSDACRNAKIIKNEHVGEKFGKLTIVSDFQQNGRRYAECKCECGGNKTTLYKSLKRGDTTSCGCVKLKDVSGRANAYGVKLIRRTRKEAEEKIYGGFIEEFKKNHPDRWKIVEESHERNRKKER